MLSAEDAEICVDTGVGVGDTVLVGNGEEEVDGVVDTEGDTEVVGDEDGIVVTVGSGVDVTGITTGVTVTVGNGLDITDGVDVVVGLGDT